MLKSFLLTRYPSKLSKHNNLVLRPNLFVHLFLNGFYAFYQPLVVIGRAIIILFDELTKLELRAND